MRRAAAPQASELYALAAKTLNVPEERLKLVCKGKAIDKAAASLSLDPNGAHQQPPCQPSERHRQAPRGAPRPLPRMRVRCPEHRPAPAPPAATILAVPLPKGPDEAIRRAAAADKGLDDDDAELDAFTLPEGAGHPGLGRAAGSAA
jgi:hypothetical protein